MAKTKRLPPPEGRSVQLRCNFRYLLFGVPCVFGIEYKPDQLYLCGWALAWPVEFRWIWYSPLGGGDIFFWVPDPGAILVTILRSGNSCRPELPKGGFCGWRPPAAAATALLCLQSDFTVKTVTDRPASAPARPSIIQGQKCASFLLLTFILHSIVIIVC